MQAKTSKESKFVNGNGTKQIKHQIFKKGGYDPSYIYYIQMKNQEWKKGRIIDVRQLEDIDPNLPKNYFSYRYYVHYFGLNRRMDDWVTAEKLKKTEFTIHDLKRKNEGIMNISQKCKKFMDSIESSEDEGLDPKEQECHQEATRVKTISQIQIGKFLIDAWYYSPFPEGFHTYHSLYFCEFCLSFYIHDNELQRHNLRCKLVHPPGNQIYEDNKLKIAMFEVDGEKSWEFAENLSYLSKLFLDHKFIWYTVDTFLFYVLCEIDDNGYHFVGYFSKNKDFNDPHNLSCILVLPCYQKKGYGKFLINFSYSLSEIEKKIGTPERPLSDLGKLVYMRYWGQRIINYLIQLNQEQLENMTIKQISEGTFIRDQDVIDALENINILKKVKNQIFLCFKIDFLQQIYKKLGREAIYIKKQNLHWIPYKNKFDSFDQLQININ